MFPRAFLQRTGQRRGLPVSAVSTIEHVGVPAATKPRVCVPNKKDERNVAGEVADKSVLDAALINAAQAAEHYEIAR